VEHLEAVAKRIDDRSEPIIGVLIYKDHSLRAAPSLGGGRGEKALDLDSPSEGRNDQIDAASFRHGHAG
jgi:hypothetical protein